MLGEKVKVIVDRPIGSLHPEYKNICYSVNYGYIPGVFSPDEEWQDAYILGVDVPIKEFVGRVIAVIHRREDIETKWVVAPENVTFTKEQIMKQIEFQEQFFHIFIEM